MLNCSNRGCLMFTRTRSVVTSAAVAATVLAISLTAAPALAQGSASDLRAQYLADLETLESKFNDLAGAMDADLYGWRPMEGVRSVSEVFMLIVAENYVVPAAWGAEPPEGMAVSSASSPRLPTSRKSWNGSSAHSPMRSTPYRRFQINRCRKPSACSGASAPCRHRCS